MIKINETNYLSEINKLRSLQEGWDSYDSPVPREFTYPITEEIVKYAISLNFSPLAIKASADGGIALIYIGEGIKRAFIEILNTHEIYTVLYDIEGNSFTIEWPKDYHTQLEVFLSQIIHYLS